MRSNHAPVRSDLSIIPRRTTVRMTLLDGFGLEMEGQSLAVGGRGQRLLAFLALHGGAARSVVAGMLWPEVPEERARASLRAGVCELQRSAPGLLAVGLQSLSLSPALKVDVTELLAVAGTALRATLEAWDGAVPETVVDLLPGNRLAGPLLTGWTDDWVLAERERLQHVRLHALDAWVARATALEFYALALSLAEAAVAEDPLRESAHRRLMQVHLAQGDVAAALRQYEVFQHLLHQALGIRPSRLITDLAEKILQVSR